MDRPCSLLIAPFEREEPPTVQELKKQLEQGDVETKIAAMKVLFALRLR